MLNANEQSLISQEKSELLYISITVKKLQALNSNYDDKR